MSKVINMDKSAPYSIDGGFEALWDEAEQYGRVSVETPGLFSKSKYSAEIVGKTRNSSRVYACGDADSKQEALSLAIEEARAANVVKAEA